MMGGGEGVLEWSIERARGGGAGFLIRKMGIAGGFLIHECAEHDIISFLIQSINHTFFHQLISPLT